MFREMRPRYMWNCLETVTRPVVALVPRLLMNTLLFVDFELFDYQVQGPYSQHDFI